MDPKWGFWYTSFGGWWSQFAKIGERQIGTFPQKAGFKQRMFQSTHHRVQHDWQIPRHPNTSSGEWRLIGMRQGVRSTEPQENYYLHILRTSGFFSWEKKGVPVFFLQMALFGCLLFRTVSADLPTVGWGLEESLVYVGCESPETRRPVTYIERTDGIPY